MQLIRFSPAQLPPSLFSAFNRWMERAEVETHNLMFQWELGLRQGKQQPRLEFKPAVWSSLKKIVGTQVFNDKCAYCETALPRGGCAMDHFRPKRKPRAPTPVNHPGYFWLAYNWRNLLPTCPHCNSKFKLNRFPVRSVHATESGYPKPENLDEVEQPLLLCPYGPENPMQHLEYVASGDVMARNNSDRGLETIKSLGLNENALLRRRNDAIRAALSDFFSEIGRVERDPKMPSHVYDEATQVAATAYLERYWLGVAEYSAAVLDVLRQFNPPNSHLHPDRLALRRGAANSPSKN